MIFLDWRNNEEIYIYVENVDDLDECIKWLKRKRDQARAKNKNYFSIMQIGKEVRHG